MNMLKVTTEYEDVLQNIELSIIRVHRHLIPLVDYDVMEALEALITTFKHISQGREPQVPRLSDRACQVYGDVLEVCIWRMGTEAVSADLGELPDGVRVCSAAEIVTCLKRILKSVNKWNKGFGRLGYLTYVGKHLP
jgi:hypothetical protein